MASKNEKKDWRQTIRDLKVEEHLDILQENGIRFDPTGIGDPERPTIQIVGGLLCRRLTDRDTTSMVIARRHEAELAEITRKGGRGDQLIDFDLQIVGAWSRYDGKRVVVLDEDDQAIVEIATPLAVYNEGGCTIPESAIDSMVVWFYRGDRRMGGLFLPLDLEKADRDGWFSRAAAHSGIRTSVNLYPGLSRIRRGAGRVEPQAVHLSGLRIISPLPAITGWGVPCEVHLTQHGGVIFAIPLPSVGTEAAEAAVAEAVTDSTEIEIGDGVEVGPDEVRVAKGVIKKVWEVLATAHITRGVEFDPITPDSSRAHIRAAHRAVAKEIHPDKLEARLRAVPGVPEAVIRGSIERAGRQWGPMSEAFKKALNLRDGEGEKVGAALEGLTLTSEALTDARKHESGEDMVTNAIATGLGVAFNWKNANHLGLRKMALETLKARDTAAEQSPETPPEETPAPPAEDTPAPT